MDLPLGSRTARAPFERLTRGAFQTCVQGFGADLRRRALDAGAEMADRKIIETIYGKQNKYEVVRVTKTFGGYEFYIYKNGDYYRGWYSSLAAAVEAAKKER